MNTNRHPVGWVEVDFADGAKDMPIQQVILHIPLWEVIRKLGKDVYQRHIFHEGIQFSKGIFKKMLTHLYTELYLADDQADLDQLIQALWVCINQIDDFGTFELAEHHCGLNLAELVELLKDPVLEPILNVDLDNKFGTDIIESRMSEARAKLTKCLETKDVLVNESLLHYQQSNILNPNQITQSLIAFGLRTEINDIVIPRAVKGASITGMRTIEDIAIEQQAARKAAIMNHEAIRKSQYWGRKLQLLCSSLEKLYTEPCGHHRTVEVTILATTHKNYIGKYIIGPKGEHILLTSKNTKQYFDKTVNMITVGGCKHTDGVCLKCLGLVARNLPKTINVGTNSASVLVSVVSQMILSTKHLIKTLSQIYSLPDPATTYMDRTDTGIYFMDKFRKEGNWKLGIYFDDLYGSQSDLLEINEELAIPEERFSNIRHILFQAEDGTMTELPLVVDGQNPFLTFEFLVYMKEKYADLVSEEDVLWVPIRGMPKMPILRASIVNDSMFAYVTSVQKFLENGMLAKHKTFGSALAHFSELVWSKVPDINILHLENILRAHMIHNKQNWDIPVVDNLLEVCFGKTPDILKSRTLSGQFSFEEHKKQFSSASMYVTPKARGPFDAHYDFDKRWLRG